MALRGNTPTGPTHPGTVTIARNDRLVTALVAQEFVGVWKNRPAHAEVCNRGWQSEWAGVVHGDTMTIPVLPRYRVIDGYSGPDEDTFQPQKELAPSRTLTLNQPSKIETARDMFDRGLFMSPKLESQKARRKVQSLVDTVEISIARAERDGYYRGAQSIQYPSTGATTSNSKCVAAGPDSTNFPTVAAFTKARASLVALGVTMREYCAILSPAAQESFSRGALAAQYELPWGGQAARTSMVSGAGKLGWVFKESVHNGTFAYGNLANTSRITVRTAPAEGDPAIAVQGGVVGQTIPKDTLVAFGGSNAVNEVLGDPAPMLEHYRVTADSTFGAGGRVSLPLDHAIRASTTGEAKRSRNCTALPAAGATVYINNLDSGDAGPRAAYANATVDQSFLVVKDAAALIVATPELPSDQIQARMVTADAYRVAAAHISWFEGAQKQYRDSLVMRWGATVLEPVAGIVLLGQESGGVAGLI